MNDIPDDASPQELFEFMGNDPGAWAARAEALLTSAEVLNAQYTKVPKGDFDEFWEFFKLHTVAMMLKGMAVECVLKSIWIARVSSLVTDGKFRSIPGTKDHDLLSLVAALEEHIHLGLSKDEMELLAVLSFAIVSGRYPVTKNVKSRPTKPAWVRRMKWCKWEIPADDNRFRSIVMKLLGHIDSDIQPPPPPYGAGRAAGEV